MGGVEGFGDAYKWMGLMSIDLGMPQTPPAPLAERRTSRQIMVGSVPVGGGAPVTVQSMTTTLTADVNATLQQIAELTASGCQIVRVAVPSQDDADNLAARGGQLGDLLQGGVDVGGHRGGHRLDGHRRTAADRHGVFPLAHDDLT